MPRIAIIVAQNFQDEEFVYPYYRIMEEGWHVEVATPDGAVMAGKYGVPARATMATDKLQAADFDGVLLPGGFESPDRLRIRKEVLQFVRDMHAAGKLGRQLGARYVVTGKVTSVDERLKKTRRVQYSLILQVIEVETGLIRFQNEATRSKALIR